MAESKSHEESPCSAGGGGRGGDHVNEDMGIEPDSEERKMFALMGRTIYGSSINKDMVHRFGCHGSFKSLCRRG